MGDPMMGAVLAALAALPITYTILRIIIDGEVGDMAAGFMAPMGVAVESAITTAGLLWVLGAVAAVVLGPIVMLAWIGGAL